MNTPRFEDAATQGCAQWLTLVNYDASTKEYVVELTHDPQHSVTQRVIRFAGVPSIEESWIDRDDDCMETLIAAHEDETGIGVRYVIVTDQREITFDAVNKATIYDI